ncbi:hypothetical protein HDU96_000368 [Phlyctochytrium bullatum]|nr:hypothetical protein HDU96_000368 [Phlyctochytrium bullatum]
MSIPNVPSVPNVPSIPNPSFPNITGGGLPYVPEPGGYNLTGGQGILGVIAIAIGVFFLSLGYRFYKPVIFLVGFLTTGIGGYVLLVHVEPSGGYPSREYVILFGSIGIGLIGRLHRKYPRLIPSFLNPKGGGILLCLRRLSVFLIGAVGGFFLSMFILGWRTNGLIESGWGRAIFILIVIIACVAAAFWLEKHVVIAATSLTGSYLVVFGIDCYAHVGFREASGNFLSTRSVNSNDYDLNPKVIAMASTVVVLTLLGMIVQYKINRNKKGFHP